MDSLKNVRTKVDWAYECLKRLKTEVDRYFDEEPSYAIGEIEADTSIVRSLYADAVMIPPFIPLLIGDCLQNLRSSLDYLVWELVLAAKNEPGRHNQFPICKAENILKNQLAKGCLKGISTEARAEVEGLQPCRCGDKRGQALLVLDELCNINKHRHLLVTKAEPLGIWTDFSSNFGNMPKSFIPTGEQATEIRIGLPIREGEELKMKGMSVLKVVFNEVPVKGEEVCQCLGQFGLIVSEWVIPRFERFFK